MHDIKWIIDNVEEATARLRKRHPELDFGSLLALNEARRAAASAHNDRRAEQNRLSKEFGQAKGLPPEEMATRREALRFMSNEVKDLEVRIKTLEDELEAAALLIPNIPQAVVPAGRSESDNVVVKQVGEPFEHPFGGLEHDALGEKLGMLDFESAARISGAGFAMYRGMGARLERALASFMLDLHVDAHGYEEVLTPFIVLRDCMVGTGQLPKFEEDAYQTTDGMFLIPTAEVPVTNIHRGLMFEATDLPKMNVAFSPCFRREAGSHGREVRGLTRTHQFQKVELVQIVHPDDSAAAHEALTRHAETVLEKLGLVYRRIELCGGDLGFSASRCFDLEVWLPVQKRWREISSCSNFLDFQARRANIRFRPGPGEKPRYVHTLNGSGLAIGRTVMALLEHWQTADGAFVVPDVLRPYMRVDRVGP